MRWECPNCGRIAKVPAGQQRVRCSCGYAGAGQFKTAARARGPRQASYWEVQHRQRACFECRYHGQERCGHPDLALDRNCRQAYLSRLHSPARGLCPEGHWDIWRVRYVTTEQLVADSLRLADLLPHDIGRVIGIPRSGLLAATAIATRLHLPLYTIRDGTVTSVGGGSRMQWGGYQPPGRTVVIDDTIHNGGTIAHMLRGIELGSDALFAVVYSLRADQCDLYADLLPTPHLLEWNLYNSAYMGLVATDLDGIVCHNPPRQKQPRHLIRNSAAKSIITARPEAERETTIAWLVRWGIRYDQLEMWPHDTPANDLEAVASWKAQRVLACRAEFYIESEPALADAMRRHGVLVLCPQQGYLA